MISALHTIVQNVPKKTLIFRRLPQYNKLNLGKSLLQLIQLNLLGRPELPDVGGQFNLDEKLKPLQLLLGSTSAAIICVTIYLVSYTDQVRVVRKL